MSNEDQKEKNGKNISEKAIFDAFGKTGNSMPDILKPKKKKIKNFQGIDPKSILDFGSLHNSSAPHLSKKLEKEKIDAKSILQIESPQIKEGKREKKIEKIDPKSILDFSSNFQEKIQKTKKLLKSEHSSEKKEKELKTIISDIHSLPEDIPLRLSFSGSPKKSFFIERSSKHRFFHIFSALFVSGFFLGINFFLGGSAIENASLAKNEIQTSESTILLSSGEKFVVRDNGLLFGGEEITVGKEGAEIHFFDESILRIEHEAVLKIIALRPFPKIEVISGKMWVLGQEEFEILIQNGLFSARSASVALESDEKKVRIASFRHPVFGEIWSEQNPQRSTIVIPAKQEVTILVNGIPDTHHEIRFSKLKKEIFFSEAKSDEWTTENLQKDYQTVIRSVRNFRPQMIGSLDSGEMLEKARASLIFFEAKKERVKKEESENLQKAFYEEYIYAGKILGASPHLVKSETLRRALFLSTLMDPDPRLLQKVDEIEKELLSREKDQESQKIISKTRFSLLENAIRKRDVEMSEKIVAQIGDAWEKSAPTPENKKALDIDREILANLFQENKIEGNGAIFLAMANLDARAVEWETESPSVIALETAAKNLRIIDAFLEKADLKTAENLLKINENYMKIEPEKALLATYTESQNQQNYLSQKLSIFRERGVLTEERLRAVMQSRTDASAAISRLEEEQKKLLEKLNSEIPKEETLEEKVRKDFAESQIAIILLTRGEKDGSNFITIEEGILPNRSQFSAEYFPEEKIIKNIKIPEEEIEVTREVPLGQVLTLLENIRSTKTFSPKTLETVAEEGVEGWKEVQENPLKDIDPMEISVNKRLLQKGIEIAGMSAELKNIVMTDKNTMTVREVRYSEKGGFRLSFSYDIVSEMAFKITLDPGSYPVSGNIALENLRAIAQEAEENKAKEKEFAKKVEWELRSAGVDIDEKKIEVRNGFVSFSEGAFQFRTLSGMVDPKTEIFVFIRDKNETLFQNLSFEDFTRNMRELSQREMIDPNSAFESPIPEIIPEKEMGFPSNSENLLPDEVGEIPIP